jgi:hypothetical protein
MGWTAGHLKGPFTARAAIEFDLGAEFAARVIDTARYGQVIYAAVRSSDGQEVFGLVLLAERRNGVLCTMTPLTLSTSMSAASMSVMSESPLRMESTPSARPQTG